MKNLILKSAILIFLLFQSILIPQEKKEDFLKWGYLTGESLPNMDKRYLQYIGKEYNVICITGLELNGKGHVRFTGQFSEKLTNSGLKEVLGLKIYPMIVFSSVRDGIDFLKSQKAREKSITTIVDFLIDQNLTGIHLDFEYIPSKYSDELGNYLKDLKEEMYKKNLRLSMAIFPQTEFHEETSKFHNPENLAGNLDEAVLMSYDYHNRKTEAGCVTSIKWSEKNIQILLKHFKPGNLWLGMPAYGYEWTASPKKVQVISSREGEYYTRLFKAYDDESGCKKMLKRDKSRESILYYADKTTREKMTDLAKKFGLKGTALWRLGLEDE